MSRTRLVALDGRPLTGLEAIAGAQTALARSARVTLTVLRAGVRRPIVLELR